MSVRFLQKKFLSKRATLAIRSEDKGIWERRSPLIPDHVSKLVSEGAIVIVEPSKKRIFSDTEYLRAGATISEDLSSADLILGIKEIPISKLIPDKHYIFFSHTHKGQRHNMKMLKSIMQKKITLSDYELLVDDKHQRLVAFGKYAGIAGMIEILNGIGLKLLSQSINTSLVNIGRAYNYLTSEDAKLNVRKAGERLSFPDDFHPMIFGFTGRGNVYKGAIEVFKELPHEFLSFDKLVATKNELRRDRVYGLNLDPSDYLVRTDGKAFDMNHYLTNGASAYKSVFSEKILPHVSCLVNCAYWDDRYPRLVTIEGYKQLHEKSPLFALADISCDISGPIEFMDRASSIEKPFFTYNSSDNSYKDSYNGNGLLIMSIDNLPAELPYDASGHFSNNLFPILQRYIRTKSDPTLSKSTIMLKGNLIEPHKNLELHIKNSETMKKVLLLGSGRVAAPLVDYFVKKGHVELTIASNSEEEAKKLSAGRTSTAILEVENERNLGGLVSSHDVVISFIPAFLHSLVADQCIKHKKHLVTASYVSEKMKQLHEDAKKQGIIILNEIGLDPGIDHLLAMKFIDETLMKKGKIRKFISWCGGLPAPEYSNNPLGYKFSWSPRGVLSAAMNEAKFRLDGQRVEYEKGKILDNAKQVDLFKGFNFEGLANRDSLKYIDTYKLTESELETMFRGTLRYKGFSEIMIAIRDIGLLNEDKDYFESLKAKNWKDLMNKISKTVNTKQNVKEAFEWLGLYSEHSIIETPRNSKTLLDALSLQLEKKLRYQQDERDFVCLHHTFETELPGGERNLHNISLVCYGNEEYSAMAKTVALPAAVAANMILEGKIKETGVLLPTLKSIYEPILKELQSEGLKFNETKNILSNK